MRRFLLPLALMLAAPLQARPALWKLADADTTIWLFGTIHVLPRGLAWRDAAIDRALASSQGLTLEVVIDRDPASVARALAALGRQPGLPPLYARVAPEKRAALRALIARSGLPPAALDGMKTWAAGVVLTGAAMAQIGIDPADDPGVEAQLTRMFRAAGKPIDGLETPEQQLGYFDALPESAQRGFLEATLDDPAKSRADFDRTVRAWRSGDVAGIERAFADDPEFMPELRALLVTRRDELWADALAKRLARPGTMFVAVGAGHLAGPDSVQRMLAAKGLRVVRVR